MRSMFVDHLNQLLGTSVFDWILPTPSMIYPLAFLVCAFVFVRRCRNSGFDTRTAIFASLAAAAGAFVGAKLFYVASNLKAYVLLPTHLFAPGGAISWGTYAGVVLGLALYLYHRRERPIRWLDVLASCMGLGPFIGKWSCLLNGDDYGKITNVPWAIQYPAGSMPFAAHANEGLISYHAALSAPVHPIQIYLSLNGLLLFVLMSWIWKKYSHHEGLTFAVYCLLYGLLRFILEFFRDEPMTTLFPQLNASQVYSLAAAGMGFVFLFFLPRLRLKLANN